MHYFLNYEQGQRASLKGRTPRFDPQQVSPCTTETGVGLGPAACAPLWPPNKIINQEVFHSELFMWKPHKDFHKGEQRGYPWNVCSIKIRQSKGKVTLNRTTDHFPTAFNTKPFTGDSQQKHWSWSIILREPAWTAGLFPRDYSVARIGLGAHFEKVHQLW